MAMMLGLGRSWGAARAEREDGEWPSWQGMGDDVPLSRVLPSAPCARAMGSGFRSRPRGSPLSGTAKPRRGLPAWSLAGLLLALCGECHPWVLAHSPAPRPGWGRPMRPSSSHLTPTHLPRMSQVSEFVSLLSTPAGDIPYVPACSPAM